MAKILVIDDEQSIRTTLKEILEYESHEVSESADGIDGLKKASEEKFDLILCDIKMPKMDGIEVLEKLSESANEAAIVMISGHGNIETAVEAIKKGAFDYISKPLDLNRLLITVRNAIDRKDLVKETKVLRKKINRTTHMIGESSALKKVREMIDKIAPTDARVLIMGENGTGKELVCRLIHEQSNRANAPLIEVNCAAIPSELIESELFGHEKGSFTSAVKQRIGKFEQASGGTIFLDEIGDMSLSAQAKVLRALQENKITRVGGEKEISVNVRVIAATNKDLKQEIEKNNFREDLYHRLGVIIIQVPRLNDRIGDVPILAEYFIKEVCEDYNIPLLEFAPDAIEELKAIHWTGNIREFRNVVERLAILCEKKIKGEDVIAYAVANKSVNS
ncbi:MAG TPA: sigma-54 dependent transcriptional regulator [Bacteroidia bacterium]|nr:sigma-54 dependent transcriptional regulator [Bacteroidia bacterium]HNT80356.1 sigma-54 dependent transcriptional regulator [Bacteroidia bacterium]